MLLAERYYVLQFKYCGVWCKMVIRYHTSYCKYVLFRIYDTKNTDRGMVNTEKYRLIPTEKYRLGKQLYIELEGFRQIG